MELLCLGRAVGIHEADDITTRHGESLHQGAALAYRLFYVHKIDLLAPLGVSPHYAEGVVPAAVEHHQDVETATHPLSEEGSVILQRPANPLLLIVRRYDYREHPGLLLPRRLPD